MSNTEASDALGAAIFTALKRWSGWLFWWAVWVTAVTSLVDASPFFRDETDRAEWFAPRSHIGLSTDALTGCQYLRTSSGGLVPRNDGDGRQIGCKR